MEFGLNSFWVCLCWIFFGLVLRSLWSSRNTRGSSSRIRVLAASISALVLLFPAISISDDLAASRLLLGKRQNTGHKSAAVIEDQDETEFPRFASPVAALPLESPRFRPEHFFWMVADLVIVGNSQFALPQHCPRAPPL
jgi:hypothetical protein